MNQTPFYTRENCSISLHYEHS